MFRGKRRRNLPQGSQSQSQGLSQTQESAGYDDGVSSQSQSQFRISGSQALSQGGSGDVSLSQQEQGNFKSGKKCHRCGCPDFDFDEETQSEQCTECGLTVQRSELVTAEDPNQVVRLSGGRVIIRRSKARNRKRKREETTVQTQQGVASKLRTDSETCSSVLLEILRMQVRACGSLGLDVAKIGPVAERMFTEYMSKLETKCKRELSGFFVSSRTRLEIERDENSSDPVPFPGVRTISLITASVILDMGIQLVPWEVLQLFLDEMIPCTRVLRLLDESLQPKMSLSFQAQIDGSTVPRSLHMFLLRLRHLSVFLEREMPAGRGPALETLLGNSVNLDGYEKFRDVKLFVVGRFARKLKIAPFSLYWPSILASIVFTRAPEHGLVQTAYQIMAILVVALTIVQPQWWKEQVLAKILFGPCTDIYQAVAVLASMRNLGLGSDLGQAYHIPSNDHEAQLLLLRMDIGREEQVDNYLKHASAICGNVAIPSELAPRLKTLEPNRNKEQSISSSSSSCDGAVLNNPEVGMKQTCPVGKSLLVAPVQREAVEYNRTKAIRMANRFLKSCEEWDVEFSKLPLKQVLLLHFAITLLRGSSADLHKLHSSIVRLVRGREKNFEEQLSRYKVGKFSMELEQQVLAMDRISRANAL